MKKLIEKIKNTFFLSSNEKKFLKFNNSRKYNFFFKKKKKIILFNAAENYYDLCFSFLLKKEKKYHNYRFFLYMPIFSFHKKNPSKNIIIFFIFFYLNNIVLFFRNLKWKRMYSIVSSEFISLNNNDILKEIQLLKLAQKPISKLSSKEDVHKLKYRGIKIGDLIYDTYLRYKNKPTIDIKDPFLVEIYAKIIHSYEILSEFNSKNNISFFFTNQLSYIHHGFPVRFLLNKDKDIKYFGGKGSYMSTYKEKNYWHSYDYRRFPKIFSKLKNKKKKILLAKKLLNDKFTGKIIPQENSILEKSVYKDNKRNNLKNFVGVIFLHCFVDAPTGRGKCLFNDFYEWTEETLNFLEKNNLSKFMAVKPHPNSRDVSIDTEKLLKQKYPNFIWLDKKTSNKLIFQKKPKFGISVMGTVLTELAYHGIYSIAASTHPSMSYSFVCRAKTKKHYFNMILKAFSTKKTIKVKSKNKIFEYIYCDFLKDDNINLIAKKIKLKDWNFTKSNVLTKFLKEIRLFNNLNY